MSRMLTVAKFQHCLRFATKRHANIMNDGGPHSRATTDTHNPIEGQLSGRTFLACRQCDFLDRCDFHEFIVESRGTGDEGRDNGHRKQLFDKVGVERKLCHSRILATSRNLEMKVSRSSPSTVQFTVLNRRRRVPLSHLA